MAQFGQRLVILTLCLLAAVIITEQRLPDDISPRLNVHLCRRYTRGNSKLDLAGVIHMVALEFGWDMQNPENIMLVEQLFVSADVNNDGFLNLRECIIFTGGFEV